MGSSGISSVSMNERIHCNCSSNSGSVSKSQAMSTSFAREALEYAGEAGLDRRSFAGVGDDPEVPVANGVEDADSDLCGRQTGRPCEAVADHQAHRLSHLGAVLEAERGRSPAFGLHHLGVDGARAE